MLWTPEIGRRGGDTVWHGKMAVGSPNRGQVAGLGV